MKREDLKALDLSDELIGKIMELHGQTTNPLKKELEEEKAKNETLNDQVAQSTKQLEELKTSNSDNKELQEQIKQLQEANSQLEADSQAKLAQQQKDFAINNALRDAGARDVKAVLPFIDLDTVKLDNDKLLGFEEQLNSIKESKDFLFQSDEPEDDPKPKFTGGGNSDPKPTPANSMAEALGVTTTNK